VLGSPIFKGLKIESLVQKHSSQVNHNNQNKQTNKQTSICNASQNKIKWIPAPPSSHIVEPQVNSESKNQRFGVFEFYSESKNHQVWVFPRSQIQRTAGFHKEPKKDPAVWVKTFDFFLILTMIINFDTRLDTQLGGRWGWMVNQVFHINCSTFFKVMKSWEYINMTHEQLGFLFLFLLFKIQIFEREKNCRISSFYVSFIILNIAMIRLIFGTKYSSIGACQK
jgi:hypothetical protein